MTTSQDLLLAARDADVRDRLVALLAAHGHTSPEATIDTRIGRIVATVVSEGQSVADVLAYARANYVPTPRPGQNLAAVTDAHLRTALTTLGLLTE